MQSSNALSITAGGTFSLIGPCLVESLGGRSIDIVWGTRGQSSVALPIEEIEAARNDGHLVLLD